MQDFKEHFNLCEKIAALRNPDELMRKYMSRTSTRLLFVQQVDQACKELGFEPHPDIVKLISERTMTVMQSHGVEDMSNYQQNARQVKNWGGRHRRPQTCLAVCVRLQLPAKVHNFQLPAPAPATCFPKPLENKHTTVIDKCSLAGVDKVISKIAKAPYHSATAENVGIAVADAAVMKHLHAQGRLRDLDAAWAGFWCGCSHKVVFRQKASDTAKPEPWYLGLHHFKESGCLCTQVELKKVSGHHEDYFYLDFP